MLKVWKCPECQRKHMTEEKVVMVTCLCGHYMVQWEFKSIIEKNNNEIWQI